MLTSVQDIGRLNRQDAGVPPGGAMDRFSHRIANFLVGNDDYAATLELAGGRFSAMVERGGLLAYTGAGGRLYCNKKELPGNRTLFVPKNAVLEIEPADTGNYAYLAACGGWQVPEVLGSRSTCLAAGFGGFEGRVLRKGDVLNTLRSSDDFESSDEYHPGEIFTSNWFVQEQISETDIRVMPGPEINRWSEKDERRFFNTDFIVSTQRDRMGIRLGGSEIIPSEKKEMLSTAVMPGTIQIPPDGNPVVLMADAQTTGGYPRIAQVIAVDIPRMAQISSGQHVRFQKVTLEEAEQLYFERESLLRKIQLALLFKLRQYVIR